MNLKHFSDEQLDLETKRSARRERDATLNLLWHLRENERRMLDAKRGYKDLKSYCVQELKLSEGAVWRRISAMRLLKEIPETETKIQDGLLNLTQISKAQALFREVKSSTEEKLEILHSIENQSAQTTDQL